MKFRSKKLNKEYHYFKTYIWDGKNPFNDEKLIVKKTKHWKLVINKFGYDRILKEHFVLVPLAEEQYFENLPEEAKEEFYKIKNENLLNTEFDFFLVNDLRNMSVKFIFHAHIGKRKWWYRYPITLLFE